MQHSHTCNSCSGKGYYRDQQRLYRTCRYCLGMKTILPLEQQIELRLRLVAFNRRSPRCCKNVIPPSEDFYATQHLRLGLRAMAA